MKNLALRLSAVALLATPFGTARANLVLSNLSFNSGQGFGSQTTILSMSTPNGQANSEQGCFAFGGLAGTYVGPAAEAPPANNCLEGGAHNLDNPLGPPKNQIVSLGSLGISSVNQIGLVLNLNQPSGTGITVNGMTLTFYNAGGTAIFNASVAANWCSLAGGADAGALSLCSGDKTFALSEPGQGNSGFVFVLDAAQRTALQNAIGATSFNSIFVGSGASMGCPVPPATTPEGPNCRAANGGSESLTLANVSTVVTPEPSAVVLMATGLLGMVGVVRRRRQS
jgi:hypothetical protein